jgi:hypothetical protein
MPRVRQAAVKLILEPIVEADFVQRGQSIVLTTTAYPKTVGGMAREPRCITPGRSNMGWIGGIGGRREWAEVKVERGLREEGGGVDGQGACWGDWRKGIAQKLALAKRWRAEAMMTVAGIAERRRMGTKTQSAHQLYREDREREA